MSSRKRTLVALGSAAVALVAAVGVWGSFRCAEKRPSVAPAKRPARPPTSYPDVTSGWIPAGAEDGPEAEARAAQRETPPMPTSELDEGRRRRILDEMREDDDQRRVDGRKSPEGEDRARQLPPKQPGGDAASEAKVAIRPKQVRGLTAGWKLDTDEEAGATDSSANGFIRTFVRQKSGRGGRRTGRGTWQDAIAGEELWIIERAGAKPDVAAPGKDQAGAPTQGELRAKITDDEGAEREIPLPLKHTDVRARVAAFVATVNVTQKYTNPFGEKIEAVYVFPLPQDAAVTEFVMTIGDRHIRGIIREREEARRIYEEAKRQGYVASLLTQERPNIFTQRVANIEPKKEIDVTITYFNTLRYSKGEYEFVFPMVVGPRFNPPGSTDGVGAVSRGIPGRSGQDAEVQYLKSGSERSGHDVSVTVDIDAGVEIEEVRSVTHAVETRRTGPSRVSVSLSRHDTIPNKDFVLRYKVAGRRLKTSLMTERGGKGGHFALVLQPPEEVSDCPRMPREMVFVLDCSGSMNGWPMAKAKEAMKRCLRKLGPDDTFQVIRFSQSASQFGPDPVPATPRNVKKALRYVGKLRGSGGTMMIEGIRAALDFPHDEERFRIVSFMTDGYIGNEAEILAAIHEKLGAARIFSFGVGSSVNRYLIEGMARVGRGAAAFVTLGESPVDAVDGFYERASRPALTDVEIDWGGMKVSACYPRRIPDLFVGRPVLVTGRFEGSGPAAIRVKGRVGREEAAYTVRADLDAEEASHEGVARIWARRKLRHLADIETHSPSSELTEEMIATSLEYSVQCRHTAFVAVDSTRRTEGERGTTVAVPVPMPEGVRYETTVTE